MKQEPSVALVLLETGKKKISKKKETSEDQARKQKTCKKLIMALIRIPCPGLEHKKCQSAKPSLGRAEARWVL